jgi:hypothetical protein
VGLDQLLEMAVEEEEFLVADKKIYANLDIYFAKEIAEKLRTFIELEAGYPAGSSQKEWSDQIMGIVLPLERYASKFDYSFELENEITIAGQQAMRKLADIFPMLWV